MKLTDNVSMISGIGQYISSRLKQLEIFSIYDLLMHLPIRHIDYSLTSQISSLQEGETATIKGKFIKISNVFLRSRRLTIQKGIFGDDSGTISITWFNQPYLVKSLQDKNLSISGTIEKFSSHLVLNSPDFEINKEQAIHTGRLVPLYHQTSGVSSKWLRAKIAYCLKEVQISEYLPSNIMKQEKLPTLKEAFSNVHFPNTLSDFALAKKRLAFDELLNLQIRGALRRAQWRSFKKTDRINIEKYDKEITAYVDSLPFKLTSSQKNAAGQILADLNKNIAMNRILQGDVGSGKTVVASIAAYAAFLNGKKSILMAPTEILAMQHYQTINRFLSNKAVKVALITSSTREKTPIADFFIGTQALLHRKKMLEGAGLLVIDEQHRFGVKQRALLRLGKVKPHFLSMTATPIPRTVALTIYGDLDISLIDELPANRLPIKTFLVGKEKYSKGLNWVKQKIIYSKKNKQAEQVFIVYPLIEESKILTEIKAAEQEYHKLKNFFSPKLQVALMHGRMKSVEKNKIINDFQLGRIDILISTSLIEVGIDITGATIIIIENAERFGLSQLHQMRGRVGRGDKQAYCLLFGNSRNNRLKAMEQTQSGIKLADLDLKIRGGGNVYGELQHGHISLKAADFSDSLLIKTAKYWSQKLISNRSFLADFTQLFNVSDNKNDEKIMPD